MYGEGISLEGCLVDLGVEYGIINKSGAWYSYGDERLGQGKENVKELLRNNTQMAKELDEKIRAVAVSKPASEEGSGENAAENSETNN
ncbi:MAG: recombinase RecA, partial [Acidaminococcaceae bacterium]